MNYFVRRLEKLEKKIFCCEKIDVGKNSEKKMDLSQTLHMKVICIKRFDTSHYFELFT